MDTNVEFEVEIYTGKEENGRESVKLICREMRDKKEVIPNKMFICDKQLYKRVKYFLEFGNTGK